jgi:hypothetical protein
MAHEAEIDDLYRGPREHFTAARDALARTAGPGGADIKRLQKPTAPAWAVNQVYWRRRKVFDELASAVERLRASHARRLSGKDADVADAERAHDAAVSAAADEARALLAAAGDAVTPATLSAITDTFRAYPWPETPGRLVRPLRPMGFEALAGLLPKGAAAKPLANIVAFDRARRERAAQRSTKHEDQARAAAERRKEAAAVERDLRAARAELRTAEAALAKRRRTLKEAEAERDELAARLDRAAARVQAIKDTLGGETRRAAVAASEVNRLEERLGDLARENR